MVYFDTVKIVIYGPTCHPLYFFFLFHPFLPCRARCSAPPDRRRPPPPARARAGAGSLRPLHHHHRAGAGLACPPCTAGGLLRPPFLHPPRAARRSRGNRSPSLAPSTPSRPPWPSRSTSPAMAAQPELAHHGRLDQGRPHGPQLEVGPHGRHGASSSSPTGAPHSPTSCQLPRLCAPELGYASHALTDSRRKTTSMWVELVPSNQTDQLNPHLKSIFLSRDQPNPYNPPTKHGSMWVEPVPTQFDPPTKHTLRGCV